MIKTLYSSLGYNFTKVEASVKKIDENNLDLVIEIERGGKTKISKISFLGNNNISNKRLGEIVASEENKFWKFLTKNTNLSENIIKLDIRLLINYYKSLGYYDVDINSSFAKLINNDEFEIVFNINANNKFYFGDLNLDLPVDFEISNFENLNETFDNLKNEPYSLNSVEKIIDEIDKIAITEQYESISANVIENILIIKLI